MNDEQNKEFQAVWEMVEEYVDVSIQVYIHDLVSHLVAEHLPVGHHLPEAYIDVAPQERVLRDKIKSLLEKK